MALDTTTLPKATEAQWKIARSFYPQTTDPAATIENVRKEDPEALQKAAMEFGGPPGSPQTPLQKASAFRFLDPTRVMSSATVPASAPAPAPAMAALPALGAPPTEEGIPARGTMSVVPPEYFTGGPSPAMSRELSAARFAAADRGDWGAINASYGEGKPAQEAAPYFPNTIKGLVERAAYERGQAGRRADIGLGLKQQEANTQAENVHSESALRTMQGRNLGASHLAEIQKTRLHDEYLNPNTDPARAERIAHILGIIKPENTEAEKDVMGLFTGRVLNKSTGEIRGGSAKPAPAEGSRHVDAQGNIAVWKNGKYVSVPK